MKTLLRHHCTLQSDKNKCFTKDGPILCVQLRWMWFLSSWTLTCDQIQQLISQTLVLSIRGQQMSRQNMDMSASWWWHVWGLPHRLKSDFVCRISHQRWTCLVGWTTFSFFSSKSSPRSFRTDCWVTVSDLHSCSTASQSSLRCFIASSRIYARKWKFLLEYIRF